MPGRARCLLEWQGSSWVDCSFRTSVASCEVGPCAWAGPEEGSIEAASSVVARDSSYKLVAEEEEVAALLVVVAPELRLPL